MGTHWQLDDEPSAAARRILDPDATAMQLHVFGDECETESATARAARVHSGFPPGEAAEDRIPFLRRDTRASIVELDPDDAVPRRNTNGLDTTGIATRVIQQVPQRLREPATVTPT